MKASFNLVDEPWLLCIDEEGEALRLGLYDALARAHTLRELQGEMPLATAALHRLLLAILHRNFGPGSLRDWRRLWEAGQWDADVLRSYFEEYYDRFDLFDTEYPFYQTPEPPGDSEPVNRRLGLAQAYNSTLFEHQLHDGSLSISPARAAEWLVTLQAAGIGTGPPSFPYAQGPLVNSLLVLLQGESLFETLAFNLVVYDPRTGKPTPAPRKGEDRPIWEYDETPYPPEPKTFYLPGYLGYLTWPVRSVHLFPAWKEGELRVRECAIAQGARWDQDIEDPMKVYQMARSKKAGMLPLRLSEGRAMWRDSGALFRLQDGNVRPPLAFSQLTGLVSRTPGLEREQTYNYLTLGLCNSNARLDFFREERMPLPLDYLAEENEDLREMLEQALLAAEDVADALDKAARSFARWYMSPEGKKPDRNDVKRILGQLSIESRYWPHLETPFANFVTELPAERQEALARWLKTVQNTARQAYSEATRRLDDPQRGLKALTLARRTLEYGIGKVIKKESPSEK
jgi:CRISPR system Cascade subunit CasA